MKILMLNHAQADEFRGGDAVQIRYTADLLRRFGHDVDVRQDNSPNCSGYDLVHIFNCRHVSFFESQVQSVRAQGVPLVVSPIWISLGEALWGSRATMGLIKGALQSSQPMDVEFLQLKERRLCLDLKGDLYEFPLGNTALQEKQRKIGWVMREADGLLPNSWLELQSVRRDLHWHGDCFSVATYGVDPVPFLNADPLAFRRWSGLNGPFVLQAGRVEPAKNQAMLLLALRDTNLPVVLAGATDIWPEYVDLCKAIGGNRLILAGHLPSELLASAYAAASCHALPSWCETCGLVSLEAALTGTPVVGSTVGHEVEYLQGDAWLADPADPMAIRQAVEAAIGAGRDSERPRRLRQRVLEQFNWLRTAEATETLYRRVVG